MIQEEVKQKYSLVLVNSISSRKEELTSSQINVKSPIDDLYKLQQDVLLDPSTIYTPTNKRKILSLFSAGLIILSVLTNGLFSRTVDSSFIKMASNSIIVKTFFTSPIAYIDSILGKPYLITAGNFKTLDQAKLKAVELLPQLKQVNIMQLKDGSFVFRIDRFPTKSKANKIAQEYKKLGLKDITVRFEG